MTGRRALAIAIGVVSLVAARSLAAQARAVLLTGDITAPIADRLRAEIGARGLPLRDAATFEPAEPPPADVAAIVRVDAERRRLEIWTPEPDGSSARFRTTVIARGGEDDTLPVRAAEDIRAFAAPPATVTSPPAPPAAATAPPPTRAPAPPAAPVVLTASPAEPERRLTLGIDVGLLAPLNGPGAAGAGVVRLRYALAPYLYVGARFITPIAPSSVSRDDRSATIDASAFAAECAFGPRRPHWEVRIVGGVGLVWLRVTGMAGAPYVTRRDDVWTALPYGAVELARRFDRRFALRAALLGGVAVPPVTVRFSDMPIARWGNPLAMLTLGIDFNL